MKDAKVKGIKEFCEGNPVQRGEGTITRHRKLFYDKSLHCTKDAKGKNEQDRTHTHNLDI